MTNLMISKVTNIWRNNTHKKANNRTNVILINLIMILILIIGLMNEHRISLIQLDQSVQVVIKILIKRVIMEMVDISSTIIIIM